MPAGQSERSPASGYRALPWCHCREEDHNPPAGLIIVGALQLWPGLIGSPSVRPGLLISGREPKEDAFLGPCCCRGCLPPASDPERAARMLRTFPIALLLLLLRAGLGLVSEAGGGGMVALGQS